MIQQKELSIQRDQANQQKAEFEKEIEKLLFDNREIKEHSRKTQRELSKEISSLTSELKDERDRIHELQKENRKLRQEVKIKFQMIWLGFTYRYLRIKFRLTNYSPDKNVYELSNYSEPRSWLYMNITYSTYQ